jgi:glutathione S-transferase
MSQPGLTVYHIPVCPFSQRLKILLELKGLTGAVDFRVVDVTRPRDGELVKLAGSAPLPVLATGKGVLRESLVILRYLDEFFAEPPIARRDPFERAVENMLIALEGDFANLGYSYVLNRDPDRSAKFRERMLAHYARFDELLSAWNPDGVFLFDEFGLAEAVFTPLFVRFWFLDYYEDFELPDSGFERVARWREACLAHPAAQQVSREEVVKCYWDYAQGVGNGGLPPGRRVSSFAFEPHWSDRPWPPRDKFASLGDEELGLIAG